MKKLFLAILLFNINLFAQFGFDMQTVNMKSFLSLDAVYPGSQVKLAVSVEIEEDWHINSNKPNEDFLIGSTLDINEPFMLKNVVFPEAEDLKFNFSDLPVSVFEGEIFIGGLVDIPNDLKVGQYKLIVNFGFQACNNVSCLAPDEFIDTLTINVVDTSTPVNEINSEIFSNLELDYAALDSKNSDDDLSNTLESSGLLLSLLLVFLGGLALNLTPCVYPLIPITIGYFGGQSEGSTGRLAVLGTMYVLGIALTYSIVGVVTSLSGAVFGALLQNPIVIVLIGLVFITLALSQFGVYEFKLPSSWESKAGGAKSGLFGAFFMGLTMGIVAAPCVGPFVIGLVTYVAAKGDALYGFLMFFFMAVGLGIPYLVLAIFSGKIKSMPKAGDWMEGVKHVFGWILIGAAIYFVEPLFPKNIAIYLLPVFMIIASLYLLFVDKLANKIKGFFIFKTLFSLVILALAVWMLIPTDAKSPEWQKYSNEAFQSSLDNNDKIIMDFYADWCIPCKEFDKITFRDDRVLKVMEGFKNYKIDMTKTLSDETESVRKKFNILGMPTIIIYNSKGTEVERLTGFVGPEEFLKFIGNVN